MNDPHIDIIRPTRDNGFCWQWELYDPVTNGPYQEYGGYTQSRDDALRQAAQAKQRWENKYNKPTIDV